MTEPVSPPPPKHGHKGRTIALVAGGLAAGAIAATAIGASAQSDNPSTTTATSTATTAPGAPSGSTDAPKDRHGSGPVRSDEKPVSASLAATLKAAALQAVPGGTVYRIETDAGDAVYEAHMTRADGTEVTVKFDKSLKVTEVESGMGKGDPAPAGRPGSDH